MTRKIDVNFYPGWTRKAISFSIDDGHLPMDKKFMDIVEPYGIKGTFNLCSERLARMTPDEYREFYRGHEIANHCKYHPAAFLDGEEYDISDEPFCVSLRSSEQLLHNFKAATEAWKRGDPVRVALAMRAVYDAIYRAQAELHKQYLPKTQRLIITPAVEVMDRRFTDNDLSVSYLAALCGVSEVYFRKIFLNSFGVSPKEYMIQKRMDYAKNLLKSGDFSVSEIATLCGYTESCHFSREFSKREGISPNQYGKQ